MGICESENQSNTLEKGNGKGISVIHTLIQPIIHKDIQPIITKNITPIIFQKIIPVIVRNEIEFQNIPKDLIMNHPDVIKALAPPKIKPIDANAKPIIIPPSELPPNVKAEPEEILEEFEEPTLNKEYEPTLVKVVGQVHHYIQVKEKHIRQKVIQPMIENIEKQASFPPKIVPIINHP